MIHYLTTLLLLYLVGGIVINGWFAVTRGQWKDEVDGTRTKEGALLKAWWFFFFKEKSETFRVYKDKEFYKVFDLLTTQPKLNKFNIRLAETEYPLMGQEGLVAIIDESAFRPRNQALIKEISGVTLSKFYPGSGFDLSQLSGTPITFLKEEPVYKFPEWIRTMMAGCITCFSSFYGSIFYWAAFLLIGRGWFYGVTDYPMVLLFTTWIAYMLGLAYVNTYLWKRINK